MMAWGQVALCCRSLVSTMTTVKFSLRFWVLLGLGVSSVSANAIDITFTDVADAVGLQYSGGTFGQSWGDYDNDGYADLYVSNHGFATSIFKNNGGINFTDQIDQITADMTGDIHAGAWGDFDNDGDRDLIFIEGASGMSVDGPNRLLVNTGGQFVDQALAFGVQDPSARGRMATWFDWNQDGMLDLAFANWPRNDGLSPSGIYTRQASSFVFDNATVGYTAGFSQNVIKPVQVNGISEPAILAATVFGFPNGFYDVTQVPFVWLGDSTGLPSVAAVWDYISEDFDGNLDQELFLVRMLDTNEVVVTGDRLNARVYGLSMQEQSYTFQTEGAISVQVGPSFSMPLGQIEIGASQLNPDSLEFTLDPNNPDDIGISEHPLNLSRLYFGYSAETETWEVSVVNFLRPNVVITSESPIVNLQTSGFTSDTGARTAIKYNQSPNGYESFPVAFGLDTPYPCRSGAAADFDNDMDVDVYLGCVSGAVNRPNILLENNGSGMFTEAANAAGAEGTDLGRTDVVTVADYNNDGFMDILVSNGLGSSPFATGPYELFENGGNANNWVHINLVGVTVNRDAVGAWVELTAGGVTQSRLQDNGVKRFGQDDQRLHFGLADNATIDSILVRWPGGQEQVVGPVAANQIITIVQSADGDGDGIFDDADNCRQLSNPAQTDTDGDGFGNRCDPDLNNDLVVNFLDLQQLSERFLSTDAEADFDGDGSVNFVDVAIFADFYLLAPGPGAQVQPASVMPGKT